MMEPDRGELERLAGRLEALVDRTWREFEDLSESSASARPDPGVWCPKEIVGHLIDSASNNHQRFVRLQIADRLEFPDYGPQNEDWVRIQRHRERPWRELLELWRQFNRHLAAIVRSMDTATLDHRWNRPEGDPMTLRELVVDYIDHLENHLAQLRERTRSV